MVKNILDTLWMWIKEAHWSQWWGIALVMLGSLSGVWWAWAAPDDLCEGDVCVTMTGRVLMTLLSVILGAAVCLTILWAPRNKADVK